MSNKRLKISIFLLILIFCAMFALRTNRTTDSSPERQMKNALRDISKAKTEQDADKAIKKMDEAFEKMLEEKRSNQKSD